MIEAQKCHQELRQVTIFKVTILVDSEVHKEEGHQANKSNGVEESIRGKFNVSLWVPTTL